MAEKINIQTDTSALAEEISHYEKQLRQQYATKEKLMEEIDLLDPDDRHYKARKYDLDERLNKMYDKIDDAESLLIEARNKKLAIEADRITHENIIQILLRFDELYAVMNDVERHELMAELISEIQVHPQRQENGQWLKSITFKLPLISEKFPFSLDNINGFENVALFTKE